MPKPPPSRRFAEPLSNPLARRVGVGASVPALIPPLARENDNRQFLFLLSGQSGRERSMTSTTATPSAMPRGLGLVRRLPLLALLLALAAGLLLAAGPLGWRAGWWHYRVGFFTLMPWAAYCGLAAMAVALAALAI